MLVSSDADIDDNHHVTDVKKKMIFQYCIND